MGIIALPWLVDCCWAQAMTAKWFSQWTEAVPTAKGSGMMEQCVLLHSTSWQPKNKLFVLPRNLVFRLDQFKAKDSDKTRRVFKSRWWLPLLGGPEPSHCPHQLFIYLRCMYLSTNIHVFCTYSERWQLFNVHSMPGILLGDLHLPIRMLSTTMSSRF